MAGAERMPESQTDVVSVCDLDTNICTPVFALDPLDYADFVPEEFVNTMPPPTRPPPPAPQSTVPPATSLRPPPPSGGPPRRPGELPPPPSAGPPRRGGGGEWDEYGKQDKLPGLPPMSHHEMLRAQRIKEKASASADSSTAATAAAAAVQPEQR